MNRKQRRAARSSGAASAPGITTPAAQRFAELFGAAAMQHQSGAFADAERSYRQVVAAFPDHAEAHSRLGAVMLRQGKTAEAIPFIERALALQPNLFEACGNLCQAYLWTGQSERAIEAACRAVELKDTAQSRAMFAQCIGFVRFTADNGRYRRLVLRALLEGWVRPRELAAVSISLIKANSAVKTAIGRVHAADPPPPAAGSLDASDMAALAQDELLCRLLECDPVTDIDLERLLTHVRRAMLAAAAGNGECAERVLDLYCSVARQCFINEYVFSLTEEEAAEAQRLRVELERALASGSPCPALWPVAVGAYFPLHTLTHAEALLERSWPAAVNAVLAQQVKEPAEERRIASTIPLLTGIGGEVSRAVRQQYEENPYPRWSRAGPQGHPASALAQQPAFDALIAGCGTGLSTVDFARQAPSARILAIDLSRASLSYAKRMAQAFGVANVEFAQADIMELGAIGRQFDFIDASGVLHHLADPWAGWRILVSLLRPGAGMQVGLYSELARRNIVAARELIAARGYRPAAQDIRRCREDIMAADDPLLRSVTNSADFFTTSECRDLLFHVQEHRTTLPAIKSFLAENGLQFAGFFVDARIQHRFAARFPQASAATDLDCWHAFETEAPDTFAAMYQFSVRKPLTASGHSDRQSRL